MLYVAHTLVTRTPYQRRLSLSHQSRQEKKRKRKKSPFPMGNETVLPVFALLFS